jgi:hypothetical protein
MPLKNDISQNNKLYIFNSMDMPISIININQHYAKTWHPWLVLYNYNDIHD